MASSSGSLVSKRRSMGEDDGENELDGRFDGCDAVDGSTDGNVDSGVEGVDEGDEEGGSDGTRSSSMAGPKPASRRSYGAETMHLRIRNRKKTFY
mmetsp:Transcript_32016/g.58666  ORF Transcript_32016/g.58666 Transcript_32016/m.58666 type:complete len:95 (-) Transcript_32016:1033-1317(-)